MPSDRKPKVTPVVKVRTRFTWTCECGRDNNEEAFTLYDASGLGKRAKGKCTFCGLEVELEH